MDEPKKPNRMVGDDDEGAAWAKALDSVAPDDDDADDDDDSDDDSEVE